MRKTLLTLPAILLCISSFAQNFPVQEETVVIPNTEKGYYVKDGVIHHVHIAKDNEFMRAKRIIVPEQLDHSHTIFYPEDITEYGFPDRVRYVSATIGSDGNEEMVFLEELVSVSYGISLVYLCRDYSFEDRYYMMTDGELTLISAGNEAEKMWRFLVGYNGCGETDPKFRYPPRLQKGMVKQYYYATLDCNMKLVPQIRIGIKADFGMKKPKRRPMVVVPPDKKTDPYSFWTNRRYNKNYSVGLFVRADITDILSLQCEPSILFSQNNRYMLISTCIGEFMYTQRGPALAPSQNTNDLYIYTRRWSHSLEWLNIPVLLRFANNYTKRNILPYVEAGPSLEIWLPREWDNKTSVMYGFNVGFGAEYFIGTRNSVYLGFRYGYFGNFKRNEMERIAFGTFELTAGFSLFGWSYR